MGGTIIRQPEQNHDHWNVDNPSVAATEKDVNVSQGSSTSTRSSWYSDTMGTQGTGTQDELYITGADQPMLLLPSTQEGERSQNKNGNGLVGSDQDAGAIEKEFQEKVDAQLEAQGVPPGQRKYITSSLHDVSNKNAPVHSKFHQATLNARDQALETIRSRGGPHTNWTQPPTPNQGFSEAQSTAVNAALEGTGLPMEQQVALEFAYYHPDLADSSTVSLLQQLGIEETVSANLTQIAGMTPPEGARSSVGYDLEISDNIGMQFSQLVDEYSGTVDMTNPQVQQGIQQLRTKYFHPEVSLPSNLQDIFTSLEQQAKSSVLSKYGVPEGASFSPAPNTAMFDCEVSANYRQLNIEGVNAASTNLTPEQITALKTVLNNPNATEGITPEIRSLAAQIGAQSLQAVIDKYNLPPTWAPTGEALPTTLSPQIAVLQNGIDFANDILSTTTRYINSLPEGPDKILLSSYLKAIGDAINELQQQIYRIEAARTYGSKDLQKAQFETTVGKIEAHNKQVEEYKAQQAELEKKQKKAGIMKIFSPIIAVVSAVLTIASMGSLGPVAIMVNLALLGMTTADAIKTAKGESGVSGVVFHALSPALQKLGMSPAAADALSAVFMTLLIVAGCCGVAGGAAKAAGGTAFGDGAAKQIAMSTVQTLVSSNAIAETLVASGVSPQTAAIVGMITGLILQIAALKVASASGADKAERVAELTQRIQILEASNQVAGVSASVKMANSIKITLNKVYISIMNTSASNALNTTTKVVQAGGAAQGLANGVFDYQIKHIQATMTELQAAGDSADAYAQDIISALEAAIKTMLAVLDSLANWSEELGQLQVKKYQDAQIQQFVV